MNTRFKCAVRGLVMLVLCPVLATAGQRESSAQERGPTGIACKNAATAMRQAKFALSVGEIRLRDGKACIPTGVDKPRCAFNVELTTDFAPELTPVTMVGPDVGRVLLNLFTNAFYAVRQRQQGEEPGYQPTVRVSTQQVDGHVHIRVQDNGTGMSPAVREKIFNPFFTTKPPGEGTGLGLSISYEIVQSNGGTMTFDTVDGLYTEFIITLPRRGS